MSNYDYELLIIESGISWGSIPAVALQFLYTLSAPTQT